MSCPDMRAHPLLNPDRLNPTQRGNMYAWGERNWGFEMPTAPFLFTKGTEEALL